LHCLIGRPLVVAYTLYSVPTLVKSGREDGFEDSLDAEPRGYYYQKADTNAGKYFVCVINFAQPARLPGGKVDNARVGKHQRRKRNGEAHEPVDDVLCQPRQVARLAVGAATRDESSASPDLGLRCGCYVGPAATPRPAPIYAAPAALQYADLDCAGADAAWAGKGALERVGRGGGDDVCAAGGAHLAEAGDGAAGSVLATPPERDGLAHIHRAWVGGDSTRGARRALRGGGSTSRIVLRRGNSGQSKRHKKEKEQKPQLHAFIIPSVFAPNPQVLYSV